MAMSEITLSKMDYDAMTWRGDAWDSLAALVRMHGQIVIARGDGGWRIAEECGHCERGRMFSHESEDNSPLHEVVLDAHFRK
jgi:hypothetical protein